MRFVKDKGAAGAANDVCGLIEFYGDDANQDNILFSEIRSQVAVHTNGEEGGKLVLSVASHDGEKQPGITIVDGDAEDEIDVTIGSGSSSLTTISGKLNLGGSGATVSVINTGFTDNDTSLMTSQAIKEKIEAYGYTTNAGDMTGVDLTGGTGIAIASESNTTSGNYSATINCNLEGTELKSTGESGGNKFLREDGDGTCSWQTVSSGDMTGVNISAGSG